MKKFLFLVILLLGAIQCHPQKNIIDPTSEKTMKPEKNEDGEWELIVFDAQYESFLNTVARPKSMYSEGTLKARNSNLVSEWNSYFHSGRYRDVIESSIDYDVQENYGLEFEYRLYQVFAYVQWKYGLRFFNLSSTELR